jgi:hypothetical protein
MNQLSKTEESFKKKNLTSIKYTTEKMSLTLRNLSLNCFNFTSYNTHNNY